MAASANYITNSAFISRSNLNRLSTPYKPMKIISMSKNQSYWASINHDVEAHIEQVLMGKALREPPNVMEPMHRLVFAAPRTMVSALCIAACELVGGEREQAIVAASSLHLMHSAAFTHENLTTSDEPMPKAHHGFGANIELLTGDGIFPLGYEMLAQLNDSSEQILRVIIEISTTMGSQGLVEGQYVQQRCMGSRGPHDDMAGWVYHVCEKKEGGLYGCSAACGAILGGGSDEEIEKLRSFGFYVGMIEGLRMYGRGLEESQLSQMVEVFRCLAIKELEGFQGRNVETVKGILDRYFSKSQASPKSELESKPECYV